MPGPVDMLTLSQRIDVLEQLLKAFQVRTYVAETAIAYLAAGRQIDLDELEKTLSQEFTRNNSAAVKEAVRELKERIADPARVQND